MSPHGSTERATGKVTMTMTDDSGKIPRLHDLSLQELVQLDERQDRDFLRLAETISPEDRSELILAFYDHLERYSDLQEFFGDDEKSARLRQSLHRYVTSLLSDPIDDTYRVNRQHIGQVHMRIGLSPGWYLAAYSSFVTWSFEKIRDTGSLQAFLKRMLLDMVLVMETYVTTRVDHLNIEKSTLRVQVKDRSQRLVESEQRYEDLVENAPEMIHQLDAQRRFLSVNRKELSRLGYTLDEMKALCIEDIVPPAYRDGILAHFKRVRVEGASRIETIFVTRSGEEFPVELYATAQTGPDGSFIQSRAFVRDLSERTRLERELVRWERLASVGSMAAKVAHEIRNPLSSISLNAELLADEMHALPESRRADARELLTTILSGVDRLNSLVEEYLAFARLPVPDLVEVSLAEVFRQLQQLLTPELRQRKIEFQIEVEEGLPNISGDNRQLEQMFLNLIRNSQDAMPKGGAITIRAVGSRKHVDVTVKDTGVGIPEESLPLMFDPFFTTKDTGTGLGLAYVQQVLQEHQARIKCTSRLGKGTEFHLQFHTYSGTLRRRSGGRNTAHE